MVLKMTRSLVAATLISLATINAQDVQQFTIDITQYPALEIVQARDDQGMRIVFISMPESVLKDPRLSNLKNELLRIQQGLQESTQGQTTENQTRQAQETLAQELQTLISENNDLIAECNQELMNHLYKFVDDLGIDVVIDIQSGQIVYQSEKAMAMQQELANRS